MENLFSSRSNNANNKTANSENISTNNFTDKETSATPEQVHKTPKENKLNVLINSSSLVLSEAMTNLINRGLNFSILPKKIDSTQVQVDFQRLKKSVIWTEFWHWRDQKKEIVMPIFKTYKSNLP